MKEWLTVPEAALLVGRDKSKVYEWIRDGKLAKRDGVSGLEVESAVLLAVERTVKRGRPRGTKSRVPVPIEHEPVVYYVRFGTRVKIGTTTRIVTRLRSIPHDEFAAYEPGGRPRERERHEQFASRKVEGQREWFEADPSIEAVIAALVFEYGDPAALVERVSREGVDATRRVS